MSTGPLDPESRDAALQKLRDWRLTIALGSAGAMVAFATVAAVTIPGKDGSSTSSSGSSNPSVPDNSGSNSDGQNQPSAPSDDGGGGIFQQPPQNPGFGFAGGGQAVSGGSR